MSDIIQEVTPLTRGIIWLVNSQPNVHNPYFKDIDYLLDGLLTECNKIPNDFSSQVIMGHNFNEPLYVIIVNKLNRSELDSYLSLFKNLNSENDILVLDEVKGIEKLRSMLGNFGHYLRVIK